MEKVDRGIRVLSFGVKKARKKKEKKNVAVRVAEALQHLATQFVSRLERRLIVGCV